MIAGPGPLPGRPQHPEPVRAMPAYTPQSLVLYKVRPARVVTVSDKIEIELEGGKTKRVRDKDISLLHPGPLESVDDLRPPPGELEEAWELLQGTETDIRELAELIFDEYTPASAWGVWQLLSEGLYFEGAPEAIRARSPERVEADRAARRAKADEAAAWEGLLERLRAGEIRPEDRKALGEVERLANRQSERSRILQALGHAESPENAHRLLVAVAYWDRAHNPHPGRLSVGLDPPRLAVPELPEETRTDLTHLTAFAIDDEGNLDPDDAISLDGDRLWVHVADVAALAPPDSAIDREARSRAANLYLPERTVPMLPDGVTERLGLGLAAVSPALSFGLRLDAGGRPEDIEARASWVRVTRLTYGEVERRLDEAPFAALLALTRRFRERRRAAGAAALTLPEVSVRVVDGEVSIRALPPLTSREMVTDAMLMAGEAAARYATERGIPIPFATQAPPDEAREPATLSEMYAYRRLFKPSQGQSLPGPHAGLGLELYARATSPLRRYADLMVHQQIRAHLRGQGPMGREEVAQRIAAAEAMSGVVRRAERLSNQHWKLVYLSRCRDWIGDGQVVEVGERKSTVLIPELAMETRVRSRPGLAPDSRLRLAVREVDLPEQAAYFRVL